MLTERRVGMILDIVKKEYSYMSDKPIYIYIKDSNNWCAETTDSYYMLDLQAELYDRNFAEFYYQYLCKEFKLDPTYGRVDFQSTVTALALLHEIGHIKQTMTTGIDYDYIETMNQEYNDYRIEAGLMDTNQRLIAYRRISYEYTADKFAVEFFNKYAVKILAILNGTTQKEIKNKMNSLRRQRRVAK